MRSSCQSGWILASISILGVFLGTLLGCQTAMRPGGGESAAFSGAAASPTGTVASGGGDSGGVAGVGTTGGASDTAGTDAGTVGSQPPPQGTTADAPIRVVGTPMGATLGDPRKCPDVDNSEYIFAGLQMGWTGQYDAEGRLEIFMKQWLLMKVTPTENVGLKHAGLDVFDEAFPESSSGTTATDYEGCFFTKIYFPPNRVNRTIKFVYRRNLPPHCALTPVEEEITIPQDVPETTVAPCDGRPYNPNPGLRSSLPVMDRSYLDK